MTNGREEATLRVFADAGEGGDARGVVGHERARALFRDFLKPRVAQLLAAFRLDIVFDRATGDSLYYRDGNGREVEVLDFLGGFGASLFGHNHPELVAIAQGSLARNAPFNAQASVRSAAASLAHALSTWVGQVAGRRYVVTLANSGTEVVEAAIKHAQLEKHRAGERVVDATRTEIRRLRVRLRDGTAHLPADFFARASAMLECGFCGSLEDVLKAVERGVQAAVEAEPRFLAIEGAFHGKSTGSLQLTHRDEFRRPWSKIGPRVRFVPRNDRETLDRELHLARLTYPVIGYELDGSVSVRLDTSSAIAACFCEPIQGEGGVYELDSTFAEALRGAADEHGFPLVFDEIQTGMGRTGTFLCSERLGVRGDYYLLSKSLGGGLAKVAALLVDRERFQPEFDYLHTSTFADDDYSSAIAVGALDLLGRNDGALLNRCAEKGEALLRRLRQLQRKFPEQIREVRGRGLMIGVELAPQTASPSPLLQVMSDQNVLAYLACGYLLHEHGIRIAPTLSHQQVLRIEPSAYISDHACERLCAGLDQWLTDLALANVSRLLMFVVGRKAAEVSEGMHAIEPAERGHAASAVDHESRRVAFLVHFATPDDLRRWEPRLHAFSDDDCRTFLDQTRELIRPFVSYETQVLSSSGAKVDLTVIGVPFDAEQAIASLRGGTEWCLEMVQEAIELARDLGCAVVGLGGHTSIVCNSGRSLVEDEIALTSGNTLTVAVLHEGMLRALQRAGRDPAQCCLGLVGAMGNVGAAIAELAADAFGRLILIGRPGAERFLTPIAKRICEAAVDKVLAGSAHSGLARTISSSDIAQRVLYGRRADSNDRGAVYDALSQEMGKLAPVLISGSMLDLQDCDVVVSATNDARFVVNASHLGARTVVVCDVAVPRDIDPRLTEERPDVTLIRSGMVRAPMGQPVEIPGMALRDGELYGCLAETILLGFVGHNSHYSYGPVSIARVREIREWASIHGFEPLES
jgi:acetylornithine/succinyldiaminopimelate/putrescine aminotransferase/predicted amino acid dehydrogenase